MFKGVERSIVEMKSIFLLSLFECCIIIGGMSSISLVDLRL